MKERLGETLENSFYQLILVYSAFVILIAFGFLRRFSLQFHIFALLVAFAGIWILLKDGKQFDIKKGLYYSIFVLAILFIIVLRVIPYIGNDIPLGYDTGLYKYAIEKGLENRDLWVLQGVEPGFLYFMNFVKMFFDINFILKWLFIGFNVILGFSVYLFVKEYWNKNAALISLLLYAVSVVQFLTFWYMYYKNIIGLSLMLFAFYFLIRYKKNKEKKNLAAFVVIAGVLGGIHRPTFYMFGLSYFVYAFVKPYRDKVYNWNELKVNILSGILILIIAFSFYIGDFFVSITTVLPWVAKGFIAPGESPGTFISFFQYQFSVLPYLPFAILGLFYLWKRDNKSILFVWAVINLIIVYFQFFFFKRFIIHLDVALLISAGIGFSEFIERKRKLGVFVCSLLILSAGFLVWGQSVNSKPLIDKEGLSLIQDLALKTEPDAKILAMSSEYSPWVLAYSNRATLAPGLFDENIWSEDEWREFWDNGDINRTKELVGKYNGNIYLFAGTKRFKNECFEVFLERGENKVYKYTC